MITADDPPGRFSISVSISIEKILKRLFFVLRGLIFLLFKQFEMPSGLVCPMRIRVSLKILTPVILSLLRQQHILVAEGTIEKGFIEVSVQLKSLVEVAQTLSKFFKAFS